MIDSDVYLTLHEELQILQFWAQAVEISQQLGPEKISSVRGLRAALDAAHKLPSAIGWAGDEPRSIVGEKEDPLGLE